jgi:hypothetical protein
MDMMQVFSSCAAMYVDIINKHFQEQSNPHFEDIKVKAHYEVPF